MPTNSGDMDRLREVNAALSAAENEMLTRRLMQREADLDVAVDVINQMAEAGHVDICPCGDDDPDPAK